MKQIILIAIALMLVGGEVGAKDAYNNYVSIDNYTCSEVLSSHAQMKITKDGFKGNEPVWFLLGYTAGYTTAINSQIKGRANFFSGMKHTDIVNWVASWCRSNPSQKLSHALEILINSRLK
tara:strand:- start:961 stop:1323 length:363 start_codon:yes stop_codon:yes gene_type:complete